ncbi:hypothetical protein [Marinobacter sp.]|uniref:hypothetical protein n=1 Tax=Marinobacter sp. TaxID=50741 RepID=UPI003A912DD4
MIKWAKPVLFAVAAASLAVGGWVVRGWYEGNLMVAVLEDRAAFVEEVRGDVSGIAKQVETKLAKLKANERIIDRGVIREIQKPIYQRVCFEPELVELLNASLRGEPAPRSAEPVGEVPSGASSVE